EAELKKADAAVVQVEAHQKRLTSDFERAAELLRQKAMSKEEFDKVAGDVAEAKATVGVAKAMQALAKLNLEFTKVTAPQSGRVSRRLVDPGDLIKADD